MAIVKLAPGETVTADVWFKDTSNQILMPADGEFASFSIRDGNGKLLLSGTGTQDLGDAGRWYTTLTLPANVPDSENKATLTWTLLTRKGNSAVSTEYFDIINSDYDPTANDIDIVMLEGSNFVDSIRIPTTGSPIERVDLKILTRNGTIVFELLDVDVATANATLATYSINQQIDSIRQDDCLSGYMAVWTVTREDGSVSYEIHPIYLVPVAMLASMSDLRLKIDKARIGDIHPYLSFSQADLLFHLMQGANYVASAPPNITSINPSNIPVMLYRYVLDAAAVSAIQSQYLAEGMSAFNFQGLGVQLDVDRTQYLQAYIDMLKSSLDQDLKQVKANWIRAGQPVGCNVSASQYMNRFGALAVSIGAHTNFVSSAYMYPYSHSMGNRSWWINLRLGKW